MLQLCRTATSRDGDRKLAMVSTTYDDIALVIDEISYDIVVLAAYAVVLA